MKNPFLNSLRSFLNNNLNTLRLVRQFDGPAELVPVKISAGRRRTLPKRGNHKNS